MKDSGIEWIGEIPEDWNLPKVKKLFYIGRGRVIAQTELEEDGLYPVYSSQTKDNGCLGFINSYDFDRSQLTWTTDGANAGTVFLREGKHNCTNVCGTLLPKSEINSLHYMKYSLEYIAIYHKRADTNGYKIMNNEMAEIKLTLPPLIQQQAIANFLDQKVSEIDHILKKTRESIEEYKKYKQSLITEAVTKGLNPDVEMKDSGIEWIGEIPKHWGLCKTINVIKLLTDFTANGSFADLAKNVIYLDDENYARVVRLTDLRVNFNNKGVYVNEHSYNFLKKSALFGGEILIANVGAYSGLMCEMPNVDFTATLGPNMMLIKIKEELVLSHYFYLLSMCSYFKQQLQLKSISSAQPKLNKDDVRNIRFVLPPLNEQKQIADYIDSKCTEIDSLISQKEALLSDLELYKKSLIYECVTGKREVD